jgi:hypothetical protein
MVRRCEPRANTIEGPEYEGIMSTIRNQLVRYSVLRLSPSSSEAFELMDGPRRCGDFVGSGCMEELASASRQSG